MDKHPTQLHSMPLPMGLDQVEPQPTKMKPPSHPKYSTKAGRQGGQCQRARTRQGCHRCTNCCPGRQGQGARHLVVSTELTKIYSREAPTRWGIRVRKQFSTTRAAKQDYNGPISKKKKYLLSRPVNVLVRRNKAQDVSTAWLSPICLV